MNLDTDPGALANEKLEWQAMHVVMAALEMLSCEGPDHKLRWEHPVNLAHECTFVYACGYFRTNHRA